jgi:ecotin
MKKFILPLMLIMSLLSISKTAVKTDIYPKAEKGMVRHTIVLDEKENENNYIIKIKFGREKTVDCNNSFLLGGKIEEMNLEGYGYNYYTFSGSDEMASTQMLCPIQTKSQKDVFYNVEETIRYNSKLPVVIYAPKGVFVNYSIYEKIVDEKLK